jgi:predicted deacylase
LCVSRKAEWPLISPSLFPLQPHRSKYWLNTTEKDPDVFQTQVEVVCQAWRDAPDLYFQANTHTVSVDEMPGLQALERIAKTIPKHKKVSGTVYLQHKKAQKGVKGTKRCQEPFI